MIDCVLGAPSPALCPGAAPADGATATPVWVDVVDPTADELSAVAEVYGLHRTSVQDCLQPAHLPKHERFDVVDFFIVRAHDGSSTVDPAADTVQELTRKLAFFLGSGLLITIHRQEQPFVRDAKARWRGRAASGEAAREGALLKLVNELLLAVLHSYAAPLADYHERFETMETETFAPRRHRLALQDGYVLTRAGAVFRRMLRADLEVIAKLTDLPAISRPFFQNLREEGESLCLQAADLVDDVNRILQLQLALQSQHINEAAQRTNEVMRVLTVVSVFFTPLNLVAAIYGMNFEHMPELKSPHAYPIVLGAMAAITVANIVWFRRRGWLGRGKTDDAQSAGA